MAFRAGANVTAQGSCVLLTRAAVWTSIPFSVQIVGFFPQEVFAFDLGEHLAVAFPSEPKQFLAFGEFAKSSHTYRNGNVCFSVRLLTENPECFYLLLCIQKGVSSSLLLNNPELGE